MNTPLTTFRIPTQLLAYGCAAIATYFGTTAIVNAATSPAIAPATSFVSAGKDFPQSELNMRKWETPLVADLDQDGWVDIILNDHGYSIQILWNNKGKYAKPWDLVMGDMHGLTIGDFDQDGLQELAISRGGGSGSNARNSMIYKVNKDRTFVRLKDFKEPLAMMRGRTLKFLDADNDGDLDLLNLAFPSKEKNGASENYIYENDGQARLLLQSTLPASNRNGQKILITDFNGDGIDDLFMYGHGNLRAYRGNEGISYTDVSSELFKDPITEVTGIVELDYDHDGDLDIYISRGLEMQKGDTFYDKQTQTWGFFTVREKFRFEDLPIGDVINIVNYQSPWPNKKLFTGEACHAYEFDGETHSGKDFRLVNSDTLGWPDHLTEKGLYLGFVGNERWRLAGTAASPMSAVVLGVKNATPTANTEGPSDILLKNDNGTFIDVSAHAGIHTNVHTTGAVAADFDNDGFEDLLVMRRGDLVTENEGILYLNQGDGTFKTSRAHGIVSPELGAIGMGVEALDYNQDGKIDVLLGNERGKWHLFRNKALARGNYITIDLGETGTNQPTKLGATITVEAGEMKQIKRSGSCGAPYSRSYNRFVHFGLGEHTGPVTVKLVLSNGETFEQTVKTINSTVTLH
ncbi:MULTISPECIES: CRTAC1 family protein [unclassified Lentimonas]|uniref:CRTAC1 family protein n=1 Tax=unclassified Lentimonas TaxID=2630993 RepID=UPI001322B6DF|nr:MULTISPECIES: CRTAC1 family protein [unclassified Lentimonas]CAA6679650.1 Unannotated [Lentimonas sp. CC4]CAA6683583.1 Unannotated [Lentimonas sp. CC6]CAA7077345.1 Unannotated [Lentimonas sp. CC4]CAA7170137.1 Unannotated [Lentimonas sp. CC21]CAA7182473.1 Unannotated [Lentimonas sp. CC8]